MPRIRVRLYSILAEAAGRREVEVELPEGSRVGDLLDLLGRENPRLAQFLDDLDIVVVDSKGRRMERDTPITGATALVHVMPPPSGGDDQSVYVRLADPGEDPNSHIKSIINVLSETGPDTGAIALFIGIVRGLNRGKSVSLLEYEAARELAEGKMRELAEWALEKPGIRGAAIVHYHGPRRPGEVTMIVGVSGVGRSDVFPVLQELVDRVKHEVPIWKKEHREDGVYHIVGDRYIKSGSGASSS